MARETKANIRKTDGRGDQRQTGKGEKKRFPRGRRGRKKTKKKNG